MLEARCRAQVSRRWPVWVLGVRVASGCEESESLTHSLTLTLDELACLLLTLMLHVMETLRCWRPSEVVVSVPFNTTRKRQLLSTRHKATCRQPMSIDSANALHSAIR